MITHGEVWCAHKLYINSKGSKFQDVNRKVIIPHRISRAAAVKYYNKKCRAVFEDLGYKYIQDEDRS
jgi:hypothetical protein